MKNHILTSLLYTVITSLVLGLGYPVALTALARVIFPVKANGQLLYNAQGELIGSALIGQSFTGAKYFHSRPSAAGTGYDASLSSGSNLGPTSKALTDRVQLSVTAEKQAQVPIDLVTTSASGLDPDITPAAAFFQIPRIAPARGLSEAQLRSLVESHTSPRQFGILGEPRVNVLLLNEALDKELH
ncbi:MAG: potassium-transporting ATPase subunit KdpC [Janthinobacterium lividum]